MRWDEMGRIEKAQNSNTISKNIKKNIRSSSWSKDLRN